MSELKNQSSCLWNVTDRSLNTLATSLNISAALRPSLFPWGADWRELSSGLTRLSFLLTFGIVFSVFWSTVFCAYKPQDLSSLCTRNAVTSMKYVWKKWSTKGLLSTSTPTKSQEHTKHVNYTAAASTSWFWFLPHIWITPLFRAAVP